MISLGGKKIVIKLGTKVVFDSGSGKIRRDVTWGLARDVAELVKMGCEVVIVSSGAVGCGRGVVGGASDSLGLRQARAAVGQIKLMNEYTDVLDEFVVVGGGAVEGGRGVVNSNGASDSLGLRQACAAVGQIKLMNEYSDVFGEFGLSVAQFLLNKDDLNSERLENVKVAYGNLGRGLFR